MSNNFCGQDGMSCLTESGHWPTLEERHRVLILFRIPVFDNEFHWHCRFKGLGFSPTSTLTAECFGGKASGFYIPGPICKSGCHRV